MSPETSALLAAILLAFGVVAPVDQFAGGMFFAISLAFLVMAYSQPEDRKSYWLTLITAAIFAAIGAILHDNLSMLDGWPLQLIMGVGGALSRFIAEGMITFGRSLRDHAGELPGRLIEKVFGKDGDNG
tara:strand:+ start:1243 stop:1629 length:387 start_codon:yes stop_codon:yes gene_type:complete